MLDIEDFSKSDELFDGHYLLLRPLSVDGATADVWLALDTNTVNNADIIPEVRHWHDDEIEKVGLVVAIKIYRPQNALDIEGEQRFKDEYIIVFNCHHTNLIHPTHFSIFREIPYLVLPYCRLGSSELLIGNKLEDNDIWKYILDVSSGLAYLHALTPPIVHQDIKPANILLDDTKHYAITDFGISSQKGGGHGYYYDEENSGTLAYMAPERFIDGSEPIPQSDIWAFGATLYEILTGTVPFGEEGGKAQIDSVPTIPEIKGVSSDIQRLIASCLSKDPGNRPSAEDIMEYAQARQYPIRSKRYVYIIIAMVCTLLIGCIMYLVLPHNNKVNDDIPTIEELYATAYRKMNCDDKDSLKDGILIMDSLSNVNYIPALYQMAFTYGWYSDSISVRRKRLLGIEMNDDFMPISDRFSNKAVALFTRIMEQNDSSFSDINANATYRLACYYVMPNNIYKLNYQKGKMFLLRSRDWAIIAGNNDLLIKIEKGLNSFNEN